MKIVADSHIPFVQEYFGSYGELVLHPGRVISPADVKDADILLVRSITRVDKTLLAHSQVKFVGSVTAGADHLDTEWLNEAGILWSVATGFNAPPVADYVISTIAALQRQRILKNAKQTAAVIGVGNVGSLVAKRLSLLNFEVLLCDPIRAEREQDNQYLPLETLENVDLISLHVPLTIARPHATYHFINQEFLQRQKPGCALINASRGAVINTEDLLAYGEHLAWCLDVWEHEPKINKEVLAKAFIGTPHIAGYSVQSKIRGIDIIYRIACEKKIIEPRERLPFAIPSQELSFSGEKHHWQDIALGVFNPLVLTAMMRNQLLNEENYGHLFDEMRNKFNFRHEFSHTHIVNTDITLEDIAILAKLGLEVCHLNEEWHPT